jgi:hypothetical protein
VPDCRHRRAADQADGVYSGMTTTSATQRSYPESEVITLSLKDVRMAPIRFSPDHMGTATDRQIVDK